MLPPQEKGLAVKASGEQNPGPLRETVKVLKTESYFVLLSHVKSTA